MAHSERERISHVARRLGFGVEPGILASASSAAEAISAALDLSNPTPEPTDIVAPLDMDEARSQEQRRAPYRYWFTQMITGPRRIEERLTWFWHDHFATSIRKVNVPYLMYVQHLMLRQHATGSFADLLYKVAVDPAMLIYLDGVQNRVGAINENFGREVMELFTLGIGNYTEEDVLAASAAFSGWIVARPGGQAASAGAEPWKATYVARRHDSSTHTYLGVTGSHDARNAVDIILEQPATAERIGTKLYEELIGLQPDAAATERIAALFRSDYSIMDLVGAIIEEPAFLSDDAIRAKVRTPLERAIGLAQVYGYDTQDDRGNIALRSIGSTGYAPFSPPNVAGYAKGARLLGPYNLVHGFDLSWMIPDPVTRQSTSELTEGLGLFDLSSETRTVLDAATDPTTRAALAINAPEYHLV